MLVSSSVLKLSYPSMGEHSGPGYLSLGAFVNIPISLGCSDIISPLWSPPSQFWFLYLSSTGFSVSVVCGRRLCLSLYRGIVSCSRFYFGRSRRIESVGLFGILCGRHICRPKNEKLAKYYWIFRVDFGWAFALPAAILGTLARLTLSADPRICSNSLPNLLGRRALTIFLTHVLPLGDIRIGLVKPLHIDSPGLCFH